MAISLFGSGAKYGCSDETGNGLVASRVRASIREEHVVVEDHIGEVVGLASGNESLEATLEGVTTATATSGATLGGVLAAIANDDIWQTDSGVTVLYTRDIDLERVNKQYETGSITAVGWLKLTDITATEVS